MAAEQSSITNGNVARLENLEIEQRDQRRQLVEHGETLVRIEGQVQTANEKLDALGTAMKAPTTTPPTKPGTLTLPWWGVLVLILSGGLAVALATVPGMLNCVLDWFSAHAGQ